MVAMPYFPVNIVLEIFALVLFCTTIVALLCRSRLASRWLWHHVADATDRDAMVSLSAVPTDATDGEFFFVLSVRHMVG